MAKKIKKSLKASTQTQPKIEQHIPPQLDSDILLIIRKDSPFAEAALAQYAILLETHGYRVMAEDLIDRATEIYKEEMKYADESDLASEEAGDSEPASVA